MLKAEPIQIVIRGDFWDSHIYAGNLYIFGSDKSMRKIDWNYLISNQRSFSESLVAVNGILIDSNFFYTPESRIFFKDPLISERVEALLGSLGGLSVEIQNINNLPRAYCKYDDSPFPELHADFEIYHHRMYAGMPEGLYRANSVSEHGDNTKLWDSSVYAVKASTSYRSLAVAAADEGLWEFGIREEKKGAREALTHTSASFCTACDWADQSIFGWSGSTNGFLASYYTEKAAGEKRVNRVFDRTIDSNELYDFPADGEKVSFWGSHDRAYALKGDELEILEYDPKLLSKQKKSEKVSTGSTQTLPALPTLPLEFEATQTKATKVRLEPIKGSKKRPVAVATAPFGTAMQFGNRLFVFRSDGEVKIIEGEIVSWKTFPRSHHYANQLHVIFDDRLEIFAFMHDFFVSQANKLFGYSVKTSD